MKIGLVSDIHGNAQALAEAFERMGDVDEMFCLGDAINQYRFSNDVVRMLRDRRAITIAGNHEEVFFSLSGVRARAHDWIEPELLDWLSLRPSKIELEIAGKRMLLVHSTPWAPGGDYVVPESRAFARFADVSADIVLYGHTHHPVSCRVKDVHVVNPGSAGEGWYYAGKRMMSCAVLDVVSGEVQPIEFTVENGGA